MSLGSEGVWILRSYSSYINLSKHTHSSVIRHGITLDTIKLTTWAIFSQPRYWWRVLDSENFTWLLLFTVSNSHLLFSHNRSPVAKLFSWVWTLIYDPELDSIKVNKQDIYTYKGILVHQLLSRHTYTWPSAVPKPLNQVTTESRWHLTTVFTITIKATDSVTVLLTDQTIHRHQTTDDKSAQNVCHRVSTP